MRCLSRRTDDPCREWCVTGVPPVLSARGGIAFATLWLVAVFGVVAPRPAVADEPPPPVGKNLLVNGGFEEHNGLGTVPDGWHVVDEYFDYRGWVAPRVARRIGGVGPRTGRYFVGLDTEMLGVDTNRRESHIPRAALYQTITVPGRCAGTFSFFYNDLGSTALSHVSAIRLAYTVNESSISTIKAPEVQFETAVVRPDQPIEWNEKPGYWSEPFYRVAQRLPDLQTAVGDWTFGSVRVVVDEGDDPVALTLWLGIFDRQGSTEIGYYRIDDVSFVLEPSRENAAGASR